MASTNGRFVLYNPYRVAELPKFVVTSLIAHECAHNALGHPWRAGMAKMKDHKTANIAGDLAINLLLAHCGYFIPDDWYKDAKYNDMSMEQIYRQLIQKQEHEKAKAKEAEKSSTNNNSPQNSQDLSKNNGPGDPERPQDKNKQEDKGKGIPGQPDPVKQPPASPNSYAKPTPSPGQLPSSDEWGDFVPTDPKSTYEDKEKMLIHKSTAEEAAHDQEAGPGIGLPYLTKLVREAWLRQPEPTLSDFIRLMAASIAHNDYRWSPPNKKHVHKGTYLPSIISDQIDDLVIAVDVSGSIDEKQFSKFINCINSILSEFSITLTMIQCSSKVTQVDEYTEEDFPLMPKVVGRGGTAFTPVFEHINQNGLTPSGLIYFTDLEVNSLNVPEKGPGFPVIWAWNEKSSVVTPYYTPRFGKVVRIQ